MNSGAPPWTQGALDRVPCPNCGKQCNFTNLESQKLLDTGHRCFCEHCGRSMEVVSIAKVTVVAVRPDLRGRRATATAPVRQIAPRGRIMKAIARR